MKKKMLVREADRRLKLTAAVESEPYLEEARRLHEATGQKQRIFGGIIYRAKSWTKATPLASSSGSPERRAANENR